MGLSSSKSRGGPAGAFASTPVSVPLGETKLPAPLPASSTIAGAHAADRSRISTKPERLLAELTPGEQTFLDQCFEGLDASNLVDAHAHLVGIGTNGSGCYINSKLNAPLTHPLNWVKKKFFLSACGVTGRETDADLKVAEVLANLQRHATTRLGAPHGKCHLLAFDQYHDENGQPDREKTGFHVPNDWVFSLCAAFPDVFLPVCSIHPYRSDALAELCRAHSRGARMVKWLPNSMGIDPTHRLCRPFYALMRRLDMVLLTHTGKERTVDFAYHDDRLGNPILLRAPLDAGVKVIAAHCASEGEATLFGPELDQLDDDAQLDEDEDKNEEVGEEEQEEEEASSSHRVKRSKLVHEPSSAVSVSDSAPPPEPPSSWFSSLFGRQPDTVAAAAAARNAAASSSESSSRKRKVLAPRSRELPVKLDTFDIFLRMMDVKKYDGLLFGDISSVTAFKRVDVLETLLNRQDLHHRLINGSDYPVPAVSVVVWTSQLSGLGLITGREEQVLNRIFHFNPLLFDLALKRCLRSSKGNAFRDCCFHTPKILDGDGESEEEAAVDEDEEDEGMEYEDGDEAGYDDEHAFYNRLHPYDVYFGGSDLECDCDSDCDCHRDSDDDNDSDSDISSSSGDDSIDISADVQTKRRPAEGNRTRDGPNASDEEEDENEKDDDDDDDREEADAIPAAESSSSKPPPRKNSFPRLGELLMRARRRVISTSPAQPPPERPTATPPTPSSTHSKRVRKHIAEVSDDEEEAEAEADDSKNDAAKEEKEEPERDPSSEAEHEHEPSPDLDEECAEELDANEDEENIEDEPDQDEDEKEDDAAEEDADHEVDQGDQDEREAVAAVDELLEEAIGLASSPNPSPEVYPRASRDRIATIRASAGAPHSINVHKFFRR